MTTTYLQKVEVSGYRSCRATRFVPNSRLSALIGINGAGKTNLLNAIRLISPQQIRRYGIASDDKSSVQTQVVAWFDVGAKKIGMRMRLFLTPASRTGDEVRSFTEEFNFSGIDGSKGWKHFPLMCFQDDAVLTDDIEQQMYMYQRMARTKSRMNFPGELAPVDFTIVRDQKNLEALKAISKFRRGITYYSASQFTDPTRCPSNFEIDSEGRLSESYGTSKVHVKFLFDLYSLRNSNIDLYNDYVTFVSRGQLGLISRLSWKAIELSSYAAEVKSGGRVSKVRKYKTLIIPKIQIGSSHLTFNQLSEGTFKTLATVFYIMTDASSCLLIEEPEVCVHHGLLTSIVNTIKAYSVTKQVIFSTHSDLVLDQLDPENVFVVEALKTGTSATGLAKWVGPRGKVALGTYLNETGTLGEYWRTGGLS